MPYIDLDSRKALDNGRKSQKAGELNYQVSKLLNDFCAMKGLTYATVNEAIGALECAKLEFYRRIAIPYEDLKIGENTDVYNFKNTEA